jgi:xylulokinase
MLEWFRRELGAEERRRAEAEGRVDWDVLMECAKASPPGSRGVMFLPHMSGSHCPVVDPRSAGAFVGLRNMATKGDLLRAVVEGLNFQFLQVLRGFESALGVRADRVVAVGGPTNNVFWMQNKADLSGRTIEAPELDEAVPLGAAILAGLGVGLYRDLDDAFARVWRPGRRYEPDLALHARYAEQLKVYEQLHPALAPIHARLRA